VNKDEYIKNNNFAGSAACMGGCQRSLAAHLWHWHVSHKHGCILIY